MDPEYWRNRWAERRIGWHQGHPNPRLVAHAGVLAGARRILVPLCGKSVDLAWLAAREGAPSVIGIELVEDAARAFFSEQSIPVHRTHDGPLVRYEGATVEIVVADFFETSASELGRFDGVFDRAALVAMPSALRPRYVEHLRSLLEPGARVLLVTFEHDLDSREPPFAVPGDEVRALFRGCAIARLEEVDEDPSSSLRARGATFVREAVYRIELPA